MQEVPAPAIEHEAGQDTAAVGPGIDADAIRPQLRAFGDAVAVHDDRAVILPPMPAFYHRPKSIMDLIHQSLGKALDQVGIEHDLFRRWTGHGEETRESRRTPA